MTTDILNLPKWDVTELEEGHDEYTIKARYTVLPTVCLSCGVINPRLHRYGTKQQPFRDLPIHGKKVRLLVQRKKWKCLECSRTFFEQLSDLDDHHRSTKRLVGWVQQKALERTFTSIASEIGVDEGTIRNIFNRHVAHLEETVVFNTPKWLGIDEIHMLGQARCVLTNIEARTLIDILPGRKRSEVAKRLMILPQRDTIELVAMDMWSPYRDAVRDVLPQAIIVIDKFHIVRMANAAVEKVRKQIRQGQTDRQRRSLMHDRYLLLRRRADLPPHKFMLLETWLDVFPDLKAAYELKEDFYDIWDTAPDSPTALLRYRKWLAEAIARKVAWAFSDLTTALANWEAEAFAYFDHPVTNAATEALNGVARVVNRMGRGYSFRAIRAKMLYTAKGKQPNQPKLKEPKMTTEPLPDRQPPIDMIIYYSDGVELIQLKDVIVSQEQADRQSTMIENYQEELDPDDSILYSE